MTILLSRSSWTNIMFILSMRCRFKSSEPMLVLSRADRDDSPILGVRPGVWCQPLRARGATHLGGRPSISAGRPSATLMFSVAYERAVLGCRPLRYHAKMIRACIDEDYSRASRADTTSWSRPKSPRSRGRLRSGSRDAGDPWRQLAPRRGERRRRR